MNEIKVIERDRRALRLKSLTVKWVMIATRIACQKSIDWRERFQKHGRNFLATSAHALKWGLVLDKESINTQYQTKLDNGVNCTWKWVSCIHALMNQHRWIKILPFIFKTRMHILSHWMINCMNVANPSPHIVWRL